MKLYTLGYESITSQLFVETLLLAGVRQLVDVRQLPLSRKPGFSKSALARLVAGHGIGYVHCAALGCPREIRDDYKKDGNWETYTTRFLSYLPSQDDLLHGLVSSVLAVTSCLVCFEADYRCCHRSFVADRLSALSHGTIAVEHLRCQRISQKPVAVPRSAIPAVGLSPR